MQTGAEPEVFIVPGFHGSDDEHWQSWLQGQLGDRSQRLTAVDWERPILSLWAGEIRQQLQRSKRKQWIVAHSFGCLAASIAVADIPWQVAGLVFVAPADPARFDLLGCLEAASAASAASARDAANDRVEGLWPVIPRQSLALNGVLVASENDPWLPVAVAERMAHEWDLDVINAGLAGHINNASGHGPWPFVLELLERLMADAHSETGHDTGSAQRMLMRRGRGSVLAHVRQQTRRQMERHL